MNIYVKGRKIVLGQKDYVAKGGEGSIYRQGNTAFKIYEDLQKMIPPAKIGELSKLNCPEIVSPIDEVYNDQKHLIGFTMNWLGDDNYALCKLFTNKFRQDVGVTPESTVELVDKIKNITHFIHENNCLVVDGNELNYLVGKDLTTPYFIDVNTWQTPSFQATAIMPSIRDWSTDSFDKGTDWFSFAIVSFQLFVGIHPFKGRHKAYKRNDFRTRIIDGVSVFNSEVSLPHSVRDFSVIPSAYKDWYFKMFEHGNRIAPPNLPGQFGVIQVNVHVLQSTDNFEIREIREFPDEVLHHNASYMVTKTDKHIYIGKTDYRVDDAEVLFTPLEQIPILVKIENGKVKFKALNHNSPSIDLSAQDMMITNNILYLRNREKLMEMDFKVMGGNIHPIIKRTWNIEANASQLFSNVIYQSALGSTVLSIPTSTHTQSSFITKRIPELDDYRIIDAKYENKVCVLTGHKGSVYTRIIIVFDEKHDKYTLRFVDGVDYSSINFTTLDNGVCVMITDDDAVEIFINRVDKPDVKRIEDPSINSTMRLFKNGTQVMFSKDNKIYSMKMR